MQKMKKTAVPAAAPVTPPAPNPVPTYEEVLGLLTSTPAVARGAVAAGLKVTYPALADTIFRALAAADGKRVLIEDEPPAVVVTPPTVAPAKAPREVKPALPEVAETTGAALRSLVDVFEDVLPGDGTIHLAVKDGRIGLMARLPTQDLIITQAAQTGGLKRAWATTPKSLLQALKGTTGPVKLEPKGEGLLVNGVALAASRKPFTDLSAPAVKPEVLMLGAGQLAWALSFADVASGGANLPEDQVAKLKDTLFFTGDTVAASDGHRLHWMTLPGGTALPEPRSMPAEVFRGYTDFLHQHNLLGEAACFEYWAGAKLLRVTVAKGALTVRATVSLREGTPAYQKLLPATEGRMRVVCKAGELYAALDTVREKTDDVTDAWFLWTFDADKVTVTAGPPKAEPTVKVEVPCSGVAKPFCVSLSPLYVQEGMTLLDEGDEALLHFDPTDQAFTPLVLEQTGKPGDEFRPAIHRAMIMPRRDPGTWNVGEQPEAPVKAKPAKKRGRK